MFFALGWTLLAFTAYSFISTFFAFVATLYWSRAINAHLHIENAVQAILVRFRTIWEHYAVITTIIVILFTLFVWALTKF